MLGVSAKDLCLVVARPLTNSVTLAKSLDLSNSSFPHL